MRVVKVSSIRSVRVQFVSGLSRRRDGHLGVGVAMLHPFDILTWVVSVPCFCCKSVYESNGRCRCASSMQSSVELSAEHIPPSLVDCQLCISHRGHGCVYVRHQL